MASSRSNKKNFANVALCYIRQSRTLDSDDKNSPERQKANIQLVCDKYGWIPEWYEDADGHKSGREIKNRPAWLSLMKRLSDLDVVALVANDLSRLHRKGWRVGDLMEHLSQYEVELVLASPGREVDTSSTMGRIFIQFTAIIDEYYAEDIAQRARESVAYRKRLGKTIGQFPYGTVRNKEGFLVPSDEGAWLMPDGSFLSGDLNNIPVEGALWRSYYEGAKRILQLYATGTLGNDRIAYKMCDESIPFRARKGRPRPVTSDDVRRVVSNWEVYGGLVTNQRSKDRKAYNIPDVDQIYLDSEKAVFPVDLLLQVAHVRKQRTVKRLNRGRKPKNTIYALSNLTYCAHCESIAQKYNDPTLRSTLTGTTLNQVRRYRHKPGVNCGCKAKSIPSDVLEADFYELIKLLDIHPEWLDTMTKMAIQADLTLNPNVTNLQGEKLEAISQCKRRIDAAIVLFGDGYISQEEYEKRIEKNQREIAHWESVTTNAEETVIEFSMCLEAIDSIKRLWDLSDDEGRQGMARNLFSYIIYDVDSRRIVDFRLRSWADRFLILRAKLYQDSGTSNYQGSKRDVPHTGFEPVFRP